MLIIKTPQLLRQYLHKTKRENKCIALVPTMGNLHEGHIKLISEARARADIVIVSIFINPMQFDSINDLERYPSTLQIDYEKLDKSQIDFTFVPTLIDIYPYGIRDSAFVDILSISKILEGASRPGHFRGVCTIVAKLFNLIQPDIAFFGEKDYQQLILIRRMVIDMSYNIEIVAIPIVRDKDGLALSSRNSQLTSKQRKIAPSLSVIMNTIAENLFVSKCNLKNVVSLAKRELSERGFQHSKIYIRDADTLSKLSNKSNRAVILMSSWLGQVRLIDNKVVKLK